MTGLAGPLFLNARSAVRFFDPTAFSLPCGLMSSSFSRSWFLSDGVVLAVGFLPDPFSMS